MQHLLPVFRTITCPYPADAISGVPLPECLNGLRQFINFISDNTGFEASLLDMEKDGISAILFDLDNTLVDTAGAGQLAMQKVRTGTERIFHNQSQD